MHSVRVDTQNQEVNQKLLEMEVENSVDQETESSEPQISLHALSGHSVDRKLRLQAWLRANW